MISKRNATIASSDLKDRIAVQAVTKTNVLGVLSETWATVIDKAPASVIYESDSERIRAGREEASQSIRVIVRSEIPIDQTTRIQHDGATWEVAGFPKPIDNRRRFKQFVAIKTDS